MSIPFLLQRKGSLGTKCIKAWGWDYWDLNTHEVIEGMVLGPGKEVSYNRNPAYPHDLRKDIPTLKGGVEELCPKAHGRSKQACSEAPGERKSFINNRNPKSGLAMVET